MARNKHPHVVSKPYAVVFFLLLTYSASSNLQTRNKAKCKRANSIYNIHNIQCKLYYCPAFYIKLDVHVQLYLHMYTHVKRYILCSISHLLDHLYHHKMCIILSSGSNLINMTVRHEDINVL